MTTARAGKAAALAALAWVLLSAAAAAQSTPPPPLTDDDYLTFAGRVTEQLERSWRPEEGMYRTGARSIDTIANAAMLTVFATAAAHGHEGPARNDERARVLVRRLTASPPFYTAPTAPREDKMFHTPGWTSNMDGPYVDMDKSIDPKVAEGLQIAYRARDVLGLEEADQHAIRDEIHRVAYTAFFRFPLVRLNQINWPAELYAYDYLVNGDPTLLREDYRKHVRRFVAGFKTPWTPEGATNVGPSYRFIYQNNAPASLSRNLDSAEYSNMTLHFLYWYDLARQAGMQPLPAEDLRLLRAWVQRNLYGYWTHAGFMNWDTGWSYDRWMKGKTWAYAQQGLLAIATAPAFRLRAAEGRWAKHVFDAGLRLYEHLGDVEDHPFRPSAQLYGIGDQDSPSTTMFWARMAANAARAVSAGMGRMPAEPPPPMYALDADIGRLAVSSPRYSTAVLAVNRGKVPYGGADLARLYDADGDPIGPTGGRPPGSFGVLITRPDGHETFATQRGLHRDPRRPPLELTASPRGRVTTQRRLATRPDAGPFRRLDETSTRRGDGFRIRTVHRFRRNSITVRYDIARPRGEQRRRIRVLLPTSGRANGRIDALLRDGRTVRVTAEAPVRLQDVVSFTLRSPHGSYRAVPVGVVQGRTTVFAPRRDRANPRGGPTLGLELPPMRRGVRRLELQLFPSSGGGTLQEPVEPSTAP
jgi:hypothetical protein